MESAPILSRPDRLALGSAQLRVQDLVEATAVNQPREAPATLEPRRCMLRGTKRRWKGLWRSESRTRSLAIDDPRQRPFAPAERSETASYTLSAEQLASYPCDLEMESGRRVAVTSSGDGLSLDLGYGAFRLEPESATRFRPEDSGDPVLFELSPDGRVSRVWSEQLCYLEAADAVKRDDLEAAVAWVQRGAERFPESSRLQYNLARALLGTGRRAEALSHLRTALEIDPHNRAATKLLTRLRLRRFAPWIVLALILAWPLALLVLRRMDRSGRVAVRGPSSGIPQ